MASVKKYQKGYIALMSSIIVSTVLVALIVSLSSSTFLTRFTILDEEYKAMSGAFSYSCIQEALLAYKEDVPYKNECLVGEINNVSGVGLEILTTSVHKNIYTNHKTIVHPQTFLVISIEEI